ncbi:MAG: 23S rRNA (guanosine(2251)-2'-O)-methyltransferase RlmB [Myxococcales bacterium]|nr:23S rRNA (guanosine(2251)-2'-O)-methyltransferase RlmB [Polyangiaceae bacterium]MDW8248547.1 23S rRNA (guanosine(2251)-2'-O)-methyltransferase RlmB [Myxococcales bacterium]
MSRLVLGINCVREALRAHGAQVQRVLLEQGDSPALAGLERMATSLRVPVERVPRGRLERMARGVLHQGAAAQAPELRLLPLDTLTKHPLVLALDELQDPHNFGAVVRSAVAIADAPVLWPEHASAPLSPAMFRASAGAIEHAKLVRVKSLRSTLRQLAVQGFQVLGLDGQAERALHDFDLTLPTVLVLGSEGSGLRRGIKGTTTAMARLPMTGRFDSLNVSTAAAIALYEWRRQTPPLPHDPSP